MRRIRRKRTAEKEHNDRWLLTYADMITLLLGLFIILYSISKVDTAKLKSVAQIVRSGFGIKDGGASFVFEGGSGILEDDEIPRSPLYRLWERIGYSLKKLKDASKLTLGLATTEEIKLVLFSQDLAESDLKPDPDTEYAFSKIADLSRAMDVDIIIRVQIPHITEKQKSQFSNRWDFHANRASVLAKYISEKYNIQENRLIVEGLAEFRQLDATESGPEGKARQERIEIIIRKKEK